MDKHPFLIQGTQSTFKMESLDPLKNNINPSLGLTLSFLVLHNVPGSSEGLPRRPCGALSMPNDKFGYQKR